LGLFPRIKADKRIEMKRDFMDFRTALSAMCYRKQQNSSVWLKPVGNSLFAFDENGMRWNCYVKTLKGKLEGGITYEYDTYYFVGKKYDDSDYEGMLLFIKHCEYSNFVHGSPSKFELSPLVYDIITF